MRGTKKKILLQTMPHTGTHMAHYLFGVLGGIEIVWHHWEKACLKDIYIARDMDWSDFVFVRTYRETLETVRAYKEHAVTSEAGAKYYTDCADVFVQYRRDFPRPIILELGDNQQMTSAALEVFYRCGVVPPEEALNYMTTWEKINSTQDDKELPNAAIKSSLKKGRVSTWHTN